MAKPSPSAALRKELRAKIIARIEQLDLSRSAAEKTLGMTAAQISRLEGNEDIFSLDRLVDAAMRIGLSVRISATRPYGRK
jgi:predicted XRE-type DNA-binding protein